jgi:hypothetical protein
MQWAYYASEVLIKGSRTAHPVKAFDIKMNNGTMVFINGTIIMPQM